MNDVIIKHYDIHGLVYVYIESRQPNKEKEIGYHLAEFEVSSTPGRMPDIIIKDYRETPEFKDAVVIDNIFYYKDDFLNMPGYRLCFNLNHDPIIVYCDRLVLPVNLLIHLALIRKGYSLIHAAGIEFKERCFLLPAFGGIGKTTLVSGIVFAGGKLYGDDLIIINSEKALSYPQDFSVYPYHLNILKISDSAINRKFKRTRLLNRITDMLESSIHWKPVKLVYLIFNYLKVPYINIRPRTIFGDNCFAEEKDIEEIYYLFRSNSFDEGLQIEKTNPEEMAKVAADILLHEWHENMHHLYVYSALSEFSIEDIYNRTKQVFGKLFISHLCFSVKIPTSMSNTDFQNEFTKYLEQKITLGKG